LKKKIKPLCAKCRHFANCMTPCQPVKLLLDDVSARWMRDYRKGREIFVKNWREDYFFEQENDSGETRQEDIEDCPANRLGIDIDDGTSVQVDVFVRRVFLGQSMKEIRNEMGIPEVTAAVYFTRAKERVFKILEYLRMKRVAGLWVKCSDNRLDEEQKAFVAYKLLGLPYNDVKELMPAIPERKLFSDKMCKLERKYKAAFQEAGAESKLS
jgi:hypothetical protein